MFSRGSQSTKGQSEAATGHYMRHHRTKADTTVDDSKHPRAPQAQYKERPHRLSDRHVPESEPLEWHRTTREATTREAQEPGYLNLRLSPGEDDAMYLRMRFLEPATTEQHSFPLFLSPRALPTAGSHHGNASGRPAWPTDWPPPPPPPATSDSPGYDESERYPSIRKRPARPSRSCPDCRMRKRKCQPGCRQYQETIELVREANKYWESIFRLADHESDSRSFEIPNLHIHVRDTLEWIACLSTLNHRIARRSAELDRRSTVWSDIAELRCGPRPVISSRRKVAPRSSTSDPARRRPNSARHEARLHIKLLAAEAERTVREWDDWKLRRRGDAHCEAQPGRFGIRPYLDSQWPLPPPNSGGCQWERGSNTDSCPPWRILRASTAQRFHPARYRAPRGYRATREHRNTRNAVEIDSVGGPASLFPELSDQMTYEEVLEELDGVYDLSTTKSHHGRWLALEQLYHLLHRENEYVSKPSLAMERNSALRSIATEYAMPLWCLRDETDWDQTWRADRYGTFYSTLPGSRSLVDHFRRCDPAGLLVRSKATELRKRLCVLFLNELDLSEASQISMWDGKLPVAWTDSPSEIEIDLASASDEHRAAPFRSLDLIGKSDVASWKDSAGHSKSWRRSHTVHCGRAGILTDSLLTSLIESGRSCHSQMQSTRLREPSALLAQHRMPRAARQSVSIRAKRVFRKDSRTSTKSRMIQESVDG